MISIVARGFVRGAVTLAVAATAIIGVSSTAQAAGPGGKLSLSALSFAQSTVNSTAGAVADDLTWTVKDSSQDAVQVSGHVTIRMYDNAAGAFVGHDYVIPFSYGNTCCSSEIGRYVDGTPQESTYTYTFVVPQWASSSSVTWKVTKVTLEDNLGNTATVGAAKLETFGSTIATTAAVDGAAPTISGLSLYQNVSPLRPYVYVNGTSANVTYTFYIQDWQTGFWKGSLKLAGPSGQSVTTHFQYTKPESSTGVTCGGGFMGGTVYDLYCGVTVTLPAGSAAGNWRVAQIVVFDNAGRQATFKNPAAQSVTATSNAAITASNLTLSPNPVNNWRGDVTGALTFSVAGATKGVSAVYVNFSDNSCTAWGATTANADGTVSVPVRIFSSSQGCAVTGIAVVDGAANVSLYGVQYNAPDPGLAFTRVPNTTPPVATSASLSTTSIPLSELSQTSVQLVVNAEILTAPITGFGYYVYNAAGDIVSQSFGGTGQAADGTVTMYLYLPWWGGMGPGEYRVGFYLSDAGYLASYYDVLGDPRSQPLPGGPLTFTIVDDSTTAA
ncbi:hypothetical protein AB0H83_06195 [Dactylosporangium sp. NPDC050688]|uniref:hypothetical protein n=1 Tax=Dactylosporangium sp. NPDC050688 TaxID=3157217 RepID=UPI0033C9EA28